MIIFQNGSPTALTLPGWEWDNQAILDGSTWTFVWNPAIYNNEKLTIYARAYGGEEYSESAQVDVNVKNEGDDRGPYYICWLLALFGIVGMGFTFYQLNQ